MSGEFPGRSAGGTARLVPAPPLPRLAAFLVDASLAILLALALRLGLRHGLLPALAPWREITGSAWLDAPTFLLALGIAALRDVPTGASFGKWLLCLRLTATDGRALPAALRLLRAPASLLPLEWIAGERRGHVPWRVIAYAPSKRGLATRLAFGTFAATWTLALGVESLRPSIGRQDASRLVSATLALDSGLQHLLGGPLVFEIVAIAPRSRTFVGGEHGEFRLRARGTLRRQEMVVRSRKVGGRWVVEEIVDIHVTPLESRARDTLAAR